MTKQLKQYVQQLAELTSQHVTSETQYSWLLKHGKEYQPVATELPRGTMKECYRNAAQFAQANKDYTYVEGYAIDSKIPIPFEHAWVIDQDGHAHELTWQQPGLEYYGVPFKTHELWQILAQQKIYGLFGSLYLHNGTLNHLDNARL